MKNNNSYLIYELRRRAKNTLITAFKIKNKLISKKLIC